MTKEQLIKRQLACRDKYNKRMNPPPKPSEVIQEGGLSKAALTAKRRRYRKRNVLRYIDTKPMVSAKESEPVPDEKTPIVRPPAVYSNTTPYGIASELHK